MFGLCKPNSRVTSAVFLAYNSMRRASQFKPVTHVIFDMDGLILDTEHIYESSCREILKSFGKEYPFVTRMKVLGTTEQATARIIINDLDLPITIQQFLDKQHIICRREFKKLDLLKGADRLIHNLHQTKVPFCLATSSGKEMAELKMSNHPKLFDLFEHKVYGSTDPEVKEGKPAPDIFLVAAKRFKDHPEPSACLVFEDSPNGVRAAVDAGMQSVMVPDSIVPEQQRKAATIVLKSLDEFNPKLFNLPKMYNMYCTM